MLLEGLNPVVRTLSRFDCTHLWLSLLVATGLETLCHGALELVSDLGIAVSVEDGPFAQRSLVEHATLDLSIDVARTLLDVKRVWCT